MTAHSKLRRRSGSRTCRLQNVVLVPQNPLEQIVVHIFNEFGCCQDIGTAQSRAHTPADNSLHSLPISRRSKAPPGVGCVYISLATTTRASTTTILFRCISPAWCKKSKSGEKTKVAVACSGVAILRKISESVHTNFS